MRSNSAFAPRLAAYVVAVVVTCAGAAPSGVQTPVVTLESSAVSPGQKLHVAVTCAAGTGAADVQSAVTPYAVLDQKPDGRWQGTTTVNPQAAPGAYRLRARCTPGPGSPFYASTAEFHVVLAQKWTAASTTAESVTGDATFTPTSLTFSGGKQIDIRYLKDVSGKVSSMGQAYANSHAQLYAVTSTVDPILRGGNRLCGQRPTYVTVLRERSAGGAGNDAFLTVYSGRAQPTGAAGDAICAGYTYGTP